MPSRFTLCLSPIAMIMLRLFAPQPAWNAIALLPAGHTRIENPAMDACCPGTGTAGVFLLLNHEQQRSVHMEVGARDRFFVNERRQIDPILNQK